MPTIRIPANNWRPRPYQMPAWTAWERGVRRLVLCWHRRSGKDEISLHIAAIAAHLRPANYWHCLPQFSSARRAIWEAVNPHTGKKRIDEAFPKELRKTTREDTMTIEFKSGSVWRVVGSDNPDSLVGAPPAGIVFSEWALSNPSAWGYLAPILDENDGWAIFIATPRGRNHFKNMLDMAATTPGWFGETLTVRETDYSMERVERQREEYHDIFGHDAGDALIEQEYFCSFEAAILGAYYGKEMVLAEQQGRIKPLKPVKGYPVHTAWDLGVSRHADTMAIWFWQVVPGDTGRSWIQWLGFHTASGMAIPYYADVIKQRAKTWGYDCGTDFVPHDALVPEMTSSGKDGKAKLRIEVMIECGLKPKVVANHFVADGRSALRQIFPRILMDPKECGVGLEALRQHQTEWDDDKKCFKDTPLKDWTCHPADAARIMAMAFKELAVVAPVKPQRALMPVAGSLPPGMVGVTLNDLWDMKRKVGRRI